jgi:hypothetical protein
LARLLLVGPSRGPAPMPCGRCTPGCLVRSSLTLLAPALDAKRGLGSRRREDGLATAHASSQKRSEEYLEGFGAHDWLKVLVPLGEPLTSWLRRGRDRMVAVQTDRTQAVAVPLVSEEPSGRHRAAAVRTLLLRGWVPVASSSLVMAVLASSCQVARHAVAHQLPRAEAKLHDRQHLGAPRALAEHRPARRALNSTAVPHEQAAGTSNATGRAWMRVRGIEIPRS